MWWEIVEEQVLDDADEARWWIIYTCCRSMVVPPVASRTGPWLVVVAAVVGNELRAAVYGFAQRCLKTQEVAGRCPFTRDLDN